MSSELFDRINNSPMLKLMGQRLLALADGAATVECTPDAKFENLMGRMHGGYVACLLDTVMGCAAHSKVPPNINLGTVDLNVKFVRAIIADTGKLTATANVVHAGRTMLTVEAKVADAAGKLYAHGSGTFLVYPKQ
jgi:acyl-CoA thioesterase